MTATRTPDPRLNRAEIQYRCEACGWDEDMKRHWFGTILLLQAMPNASDPHQLEFGVDLPATTTDLPELTEDGHWPDGAADEFLGQLGYHRTGPWTLTGPEDDDVEPHDDCILTAPITPATTG